MRAVVFHGRGRPLAIEDRPLPEPGPGEVLLRVLACGVCRTDLHVVDGDLDQPSLPPSGVGLVLGHQVVGDVEAVGDGVDRARVGTRAGVPWLGWTCGTCPFCRAGRENLCERALFTGYDRDGGFAEACVADARYAFALDPRSEPAAVAPWLCAGLIGYRALRMAGDARCVGLYGFGSAAHLVAQVCRHQGREVYAFTRPGDAAAQELARGLGVAWAGGSDEDPPRPLDAALVFAPVGALVPRALRALAPGGTVVCAGIHMSDIPAFPYEHLWKERSIVSVANLTRRDGEEFLALAPRVPVEARVVTYPLEEAQAALDDLRAGKFAGSAVLVVE